MNEAVTRLLRAARRPGPPSPGGRRRSRCRRPRPAGRGRRPGRPAARAIARRGVVARRRGGRRAARAARSRADRRRSRPGASRTSPWRVAAGGLEAARARSAIAPARITRQLRPAGGDRGDEAATLVERPALVGARRLAGAERGRHRPSDRGASWSSPAGRPSGASRRSRASRSAGRPRRAAPTARSDAAIAARRCGRALRATRRGRSVDRAGATSDAADRASSGSPAARPLEEQADDRVDVDAGGHRQGADQAPAMAKPGDERDRRGGGAKVEGEEGSRIAGHPSCYPADAGRPCERRRARRRLRTRVARSRARAPPRLACARTPGVRPAALRRPR